LLSALPAGTFPGRSARAVELVAVAVGSSGCGNRLDLAFNHGTVARTCGPIAVRRSNRVTQGPKSSVGNEESITMLPSCRFAESTALRGPRRVGCRLGASPSLTAQGPSPLASKLVVGSGEGPRRPLNGAWAHSSVADAA